MIAPTFESLSTKYSKPGKITFCKINVDNHQSISSSHQVTAMPTFIIFKGSSELQRVRGADARSLSDAVEKAVKLVANAAPGASFQTPGRTLGSGSGRAVGAVPSRGSGGGQALGGRRRSGFDLFGFFNAILTFLGLYVVSLISVRVLAQCCTWFWDWIVLTWFRHCSSTLTRQRRRRISMSTGLEQPPSPYKFPVNRRVLAGVSGLWLIFELSRPA